MNDAQPNSHRQLAQQAFEESLNALKDLSVPLSDHPDSLPTETEDEISWDDVAEDLDNFFGSQNEADLLAIAPAPDEPQPQPDAAPIPEMPHRKKMKRPE